MAALSTQTINRAGVVPTYAAATGGGDTCEAGSGMFIHVKNGGGSSINVTLTVPAGASGYPNVAYGNVVVAVANASEKMIGPLPAPAFADPTTGVVSIAYSAVTTVTVAALKLAQP